LINLHTAIFISYSHRDEGLKDELVNYHLKLLQREGKINTWQDRDIEAGAEWAEEIRLNLEKADIVLLLITRHFLASDYCYEKEMQRAVQRHYEGNTRVIPIILETCGWRYSDFKHLQVLPKDGKPVTSWDNQADAFFDVEEGIRRVVDALQKEQKAAKAKELEQQQDATRLEQERLEQERLVHEEQRQREEAEAKRLEQERSEQERQEREQLAEAKRQQEQAEVQHIKQERQQNEAQTHQDEMLSETQFSIDRRQTIQWLISGLGWLIASVFTLTKFLGQTASQLSEQDKLPSSSNTNKDVSNSENQIRSQIDSEDTSSENRSGKGFGLGWLDFVVTFFVLLLIF
jgi:chemotaxis protein histidine kinase CheA